MLLILLVFERFSLRGGCGLCFLRIIFNIFVIAL